MKILAMVRFNNEWAYVFDRPIKLKYRGEIHGGQKYLVGQDGPFYSFLKYEKAFGSFKAFAGRPISIEMEDGTIRTIKDDWWHTDSPSLSLCKITYSTIEELKKCYVYQGAMCDPDSIKALVDEYDHRVSKPYGYRAGGYRYDYYDFEKIINYSDMRKKFFSDLRRLERDKDHLIANVKHWAKIARVRP